MLMKAAGGLGNAGCRGKELAANQGRAGSRADFQAGAGAGKRAAATAPAAGQVLGDGEIQPQIFDERAALLPYPCSQSRPQQAPAPLARGQQQAQFPLTALSSALPRTLQVR